MSNYNDEVFYQIALSLIPKVGPLLAKRLISYTGSPKALFEQPKSKLLKIPNIGNNLVNNIRSKHIFEAASREIAFIEKYNIQVLFYLDSNYPARLKNCEDAPIILYVKGDIQFNDKKALSIVGTRKATPRGVETCEKLIVDLASTSEDLVIVSGLAYGIDVCAHKTALANGLKTVCVLGHGLDIIYPSLHRPVAEKAIKQGALITEFPSHTKFIRSNFVSRNRIIAGLSDATIVVESGEKGGALITADMANSYNRDVFAFPGRIADTRSRGCNQLIKLNKASLIESAKDLEYVMGWELTRCKQKMVQRELFNELGANECKIIELIKEKDALSINEIAQHMDLPISQISPMLLGLEFKGIIRSLPGNLYQTLISEIQ
jgi:DNA processing protein